MIHRPGADLAALAAAGALVEAEVDAPKTRAFRYRYGVAADGNRTLWICAKSDTQPVIVDLHALAALQGQ